MRRVQPSLVNNKPSFLKFNPGGLSAKIDFLRSSHSAGWRRSNTGGGRRLGQLRLLRQVVTHTGCPPVGWAVSPESR